MFTKYDKFLLAVLGAVANTVYVQYGSNHWVQLAVALLTAAGVWRVPNKV